MPRMQPQPRDSGNSPRRSSLRRPREARIIRFGEMQSRSAAQDRCAVAVRVPVLSPPMARALRKRGRASRTPQESSGPAHHTATGVTTCLQAHCNNASRQGYYSSHVVPLAAQVKGASATPIPHIVIVLTFASSFSPVHCSLSLSLSSRDVGSPRKFRRATRHAPGIIRFTVSRGGGRGGGPVTRRLGRRVSLSPDLATLRAGIKMMQVDHSSSRNKSTRDG